MRYLIALVLCVVVCLISLQASTALADDEFNEALYSKVIGDWQGRIEQYNSSSCIELKSCSFEFTFNDDRSFTLWVGGACQDSNTYCASVGQITNITSDSIYTSYHCVRDPYLNAKPCYCAEGSDDVVELCWKYSKPKAMQFNLALHVVPVSDHSTCPRDVAQSCTITNNQTTNIGLAILECAGGKCMTCDNKATCNNRGKCDAEGECECFASFSGPHCDTPACPNQCNRHGICDVSKTGTLMGMSILDANKHRGVCRCFTGWVGPDCAQEDIYEGKRKLWEGIIFVGVVSTVTTLIMLFKKISFSSFHHRRTRRSRHRRHRPRVEVEMEEFINPL